MRRLSFCSVVSAALRYDAAFFTGRRSEILEKLVKALFEWLASLWYEMVEYLLDQLMELFSVDLSYFFGEGDYTVVYDTEGRQFTASYPSEEVLDRCVVMNYFPDEANERINQMWSEVKVH